MEKKKRKRKYEGNHGLGPSGVVFLLLVLYDVKREKGEHEFYSGLYTVQAGWSSWGYQQQFLSFRFQVYVGHDMVNENISVL